MRRFHSILWAIPLAVALAGCSAGAGKGLFNSRSAANLGGIASSAAPLDTAVIQTQTLGPAPTGPMTPNAAPNSAPSPAASTPAGRVIGAVTAPAATPTPSQDAAEIGAAATAALQAGRTGAPAAAPKSAEEAACTDAGGRWGKAGNTSAEACFRPSSDGNKACSKESDCTSQCLARSRSCAPFWPMFGCTEVIQNDGAVVRLCLE
jgi:hypothetical protein